MIVLLALLLIGELILFIGLKTLAIQLNKLGRQIMATQKEIADQLTAANTALVDIGAGVTKIGTETDGLLQKIKDLEDAINNQQNATPELVSAFEAVKTSVDSLGSLVKVVDDKVPDFTPPLP